MPNNFCNVRREFALIYLIHAYLSGMNSAPEVGYSASLRDLYGVPLFGKKIESLLK